MTDFFVSAVVVGTHGIGGELKIKSLSGEYAHLSALARAAKTLDFTQNGKISRFECEKLEIAHTCAYIKLFGVNTPEDAKKMLGAELVLPRALACPLKDGEFYAEDLRGAGVVCKNEQAGTVLDVVEGGGGELLEVLLCEKDADKTPQKRFVPFNAHFIGKVDLSAQTIELLDAQVLE